MRKERMIKEQIRFMCKFNKIEYDEDFVEYVYNLHLEGFSGETLKNLKEEYRKEE